MTMSRSGDAHARNPAAIRRGSDLRADSPPGAVARASSAPESAWVSVSIDADRQPYTTGGQAACAFRAASNELITAGNLDTDSIIFRAAATSWSYAGGRT